MAKPTRIFDDSQFLDIVSAAKIAGMTALLHRLILHLVSEKFRLSDLLEGLANYLHEQDFNNQAVSHMESVVAEVVKVERTEDE